MKPETQENAKNLRDLYDAISKGKTLQFKTRKCSDWVDMDEFSSGPYLRDTFQWRIKPTQHTIWVVIVNDKAQFVFTDEFLARQYAIDTKGSVHKATYEV